MTDAERNWKAANKIWIELCEALRIAPDSKTDERMHERLQYQLDRMHKLQTEARKLDPKVGRGIHIATVRL